MRNHIHNRCFSSLATVVLSSASCIGEDVGTVSGLKLVKSQGLGLATAHCSSATTKKGWVGTGTRQVDPRLPVPDWLDTRVQWRTHTTLLFVRLAY